MSLLPEDFFTKVHGFISLPEAELLYTLASEVPKGSNIVEFGSYQARSTCALGLGAKLSNAKVWAIDHHPTYEVGATQYSIEDNQAYYANLAYYELGRIVRTINLPSNMVWNIWLDDIALLWVDADHSYEAVKRDFEQWSLFTDLVALHDTAGYHPGVTKVVEEILASGQWICIKIVDSISLFKRV